MEISPQGEILIIMEEKIGTRCSVIVEPKYWRAIYDEARDAFIVGQAGRSNGEPVIEYRFSFLEDDDTG